MKAGSKLQVRVVQLSEQLGRISPTYYDWAKENLIKYEGTILKSGKFSCLKCGHEWKETNQSWQVIVGTENCPSCGVKITIKQTAKQNFNELVYMHVITTVEEFQVVRLFYMDFVYKVGKPFALYAHEVSQIWMCSLTGKYEIIGRNRKGSYGYYGHQWEGPFTLRHRSHLESHCITSDGVHPAIKVLPKYKKFGFKTSFHGINPYKFLKELESNSRFETLLKAKQYGLLRSFGQNNYGVNRYWKTIKICIRNNYFIKDYRDYFDYLDMLYRFNKDLLSSKYVCPKNLHKEHQRYVKKQADIDERNRRIREAAESERRLKKLDKDQKAYAIRTERYQGFEFSKDNIRIKFMDTVDEVRSAGDQLKHCIFQNGYYNKTNSLLFACYVDGILVETAEFSIRDMEVEQCRGIQNKSSEHNEAILDLIKENTMRIAKLINLKSKMSA